MTRDELKERYRQFSLRIIKMVEEEIDETNHWLGIIIDSGMLPQKRVQDLYDESLELGKITTKSITTAKARVELK